MPKYFAEKVCGHWLYFTAHWLLEAMHVHASQDSRLREIGAAKFFVYADGSSKMMAKGTLKDHITARCLRNGPNVLTWATLARNPEGAKGPP